MKTTEEIKEVYEANPDDFIILYKYRLSEKWEVTNGRCWTDGSTYKLIHIRHKDILEAWLANDKVEIKFYLPYVMCTDDTELEATWEVDDNFIENYNPELEYRLMGKKDEHSRTSSDIDTTVDDSVDSDNIVSKMTIPIIEVDEEMDIEIDEYLSKQDGYRSELDLDTFTAHGFKTPSFDGEILKGVDGEYFGYVFNIEIARNVAIKWSPSGVVLTAGMNRFKLTPIKKEWYENPENFPCLVSSGCNFAYVATQSRIDEYLNYGWKLATKAELMSLYYKED